MEGEQEFIKWIGEKELQTEENTVQRPRGTKRI